MSQLEGSYLDIRRSTGGGDGGGSGSGIPEASYLNDFHAVTKSGFYYGDANTLNIPTTGKDFLLIAEVTPSDTKVGGVGIFLIAHEIGTQNSNARMYSKCYIQGGSVPYWSPIAKTTDITLADGTLLTSLRTTPGSGLYTFDVNTSGKPVGFTSGSVFMLVSELDDANQTQIGAQIVIDNDTGAIAVRSRTDFALFSGPWQYINPVPALPTADGSYNLAVNGGVSSWSAAAPAIEAKSKIIAEGYVTFVNMNVGVTLNDGDGYGFTVSGGTTGNLGIFEVTLTDVPTKRIIVSVTPTVLPSVLVVQGVTGASILIRSMYINLSTGAPTLQSQSFYITVSELL